MKIELLFNEFMHIYFWAYLVVIVMRLLSGTNNKDNAHRIDAMAIVGLVLFIMSFKY